MYNYKGIAKKGVLLLPVIIKNQNYDCLFVCGGSLTSGQLVKGSFQTENYDCGQKPRTTRNPFMGNHDLPPGWKNNLKAICQKFIFYLCKILV